MMHDISEKHPLPWNLMEMATFIEGQKRQIFVYIMDANNRPVIRVPHGKFEIVKFIVDNLNRNQPIYTAEIIKHDLQGTTGIDTAHGDGPEQHSGAYQADTGQDQDA